MKIDITLNRGEHVLVEHNLNDDPKRAAERMIQVLTDWLSGVHTIYRHGEEIKVRIYDV